MRYQNNYKSEGFLCIPSVLYTILKSEKINIDFERIVNFFNYHLPIDYNPGIIRNYKFSEVEADWGVKLEKDTINLLFEELNLPFIENYIPINTLEDWSFIDTIKSNLSNHIVFGYDFSFLYEQKESDIGHVSIINSLIGDEQVEILNPGPKYYGKKVFNAYDIYLSIKRKKDGLWIIKRKNE